jgi:hypothetical protein
MLLSALALFLANESGYLPQSAAAPTVSSDSSIEAGIASCRRKGGEDTCVVKANGVTIRLNPDFSGFIYPDGDGPPAVWEFSCTWDIIRQGGGCVLDQDDYVGLVMMTRATEPGLFWATNPLRGSIRKITFSGESTTWWNGTDEISASEKRRILDLMLNHSSVTFTFRRSSDVATRTLRLDLAGFGNVRAAFAALNRALGAEHNVP